MTIDQTNRKLQVTKTPLGKDKFALVGLSGREEISRLFHFQLELISDDLEVQPKALVGQAISFSIAYFHDGKANTRHFNGIVSRFVAGPVDDRGERKYRTYRVEVVPWLWLLTRNANCLIFQNNPVTQIVQEIFTNPRPTGNGRRKFALGKDETAGDFILDVGIADTWDYCVQYRETDFNFISRLLEQEGIRYHFHHGEASHLLVASDKAGYPSVPVANEIDFLSSDSPSKKNHISSWEHQFEFRPGKWAQRDFDFKQPTLDTVTKASHTKSYVDESGFEIFDYPEEYPNDDDIANNVGNGKYGTTITTRRQEEDATPQDTVVASGTCPAFSAGFKFKIGEHLHPGEAGKEYLLVSVQHSCQEHYLGSDAGSGQYHNSFTCIPADRTFRPSRITPKPVVQGTQTAIVVGPKGKEVCTDDFGRIKVQFHWDREGKKDENSSCYIRVAQQWAGKRWGSMFTPRIGQEVVVTFLEGDPDRPLIVGSVYNGDQLPAYLNKGLDPKHTNDELVSGIKTNSSAGGDGYNELRFVDTKDKEQVYIHAQRDVDVRARNNYTDRIYGHRHQIVGWEKDGKKGGDWRTKVYGNQHSHVVGNRVEHVEGNVQTKVAGENGGNLHLVVDKDRMEQIGGDDHLTVTGNQNAKVDKTVSLTIGKDQQTKVGMNCAVEAGQEIHIKAGMTLVIEAGMQLTLKGPGGFVDIGPTGVTIQGTLVNINSGGSAGSGSGAKPESPKAPEPAAPTDPAMADDSKSGMKSAYA